MDQAEPAARHLRTRRAPRVVGEVMGKYHPHGDAPIYDAMVRLAQPFNMRYPLVDGQGNFGSVDGDPPAAYAVHGSAPLPDRRSSCSPTSRRTPSTSSPTSTGAAQEPLPLPARLPNLLANGASGIAVGMATNIPPHNLTELCDAIAALIDNAGDDRTPRSPTSSRGRTSRPAASSSATRPSACPPPTAPAQLPRSATPSAPPTRTARGRIVMRAKVHIEESEQGQPQPDHRHRAALPDEQGRAGREDRRPRRGPSASRASPTCATSPTATACASSSS